jgi:hypothetical protein
MNTRFTLLVCLAFTATARADVVFTLTPNVQYGVKSNEVVFTGALSNTNLTGDIFLNDIQISFTGVATNYLTARTNAFFANVPGILSPGETYSDVVFAVAISSNTPAGDFFGTVAIAGGTNIFDATALASQPFQITSSDTPFGAWQWQEFGTNATNSVVSGDFADPDFDDIINLMEYALYLDPNSSSTSGLPIPQLDSTCGCLTLAYTKVLAATDLSFTVEGADDPGGPWNSAGITESIIDADTLTLTIRASDAANPFATTGKRFLHLKVTRSP